MPGRIVLKLLAIALMGALVAGPAAGQERRNLFDFLFGTGQQSAQPEQVQPQAQPQPQRQAPARQSQQTSPPAPRPSAPPPPAPAVEKAEDALRVAVFGDSLASDITRALDRLYGENPDIVVIGKSQGSSGFVRDDYFNWNSAIRQEVAEDGFDVAVVAIGINDRQALNGADPLTEPWREDYRARLDDFLNVLNEAGKPVIWIELPPMERSGYNAAMTQISTIHQQAVNAAGGEWIETYERYMGESGGYTATGPDLSGEIVTMRNSDGIHFSAAGADKLAFYIDRALGRGRAAGGSTMEATDLLAGTDAANMERPPFQGLGQMRLVEMAGTVQQIGGAPRRASSLVEGGTSLASTERFDIETMLSAPPGRVDGFGIEPPIVVENPRGR